MPSTCWKQQFWKCIGDDECTISCLISLEICLSALYHGTQSSGLFSTIVTRLSAYQNLPDSQKVNPDQWISQKCTGIYFCSWLHLQTLRNLRMVVRQPIKSFEYPYCKFKNQGYTYSQVLQLGHMTNPFIKNLVGGI